MRRTRFPRKIYNTEDVVQHFKHLFNLSGLLPPHKLEDYKTWLLEAGGWTGAQILEAENAAIRRCNWVSNSYLEERLDSNGAYIHPMIFQPPLGRKLRKGDPREAKRKKRCDCCGMSAGRHRQWLLLPCSGLRVCMPCREAIEAKPEPKPKKQRKAVKK